MENRVSKLKTYLQENNLDAMYVSSYENYRYFSGFTGSNCHLIVTEKENLLITDGRYYSQAREQAWLYTLVQQTASVSEVIARLVEEKGIRRIGYETMKITDYQLRELKNATPSVEWVARENFACAVRMYKDIDELKSIEKAVEIADLALNDLTGVISAGMTEREIATELEYFMSKHGSEKTAFDTISASGVRGAMPHGTPTDKVVADGEMLTLDFGACFNGYMSDITRTLWIGDPADELIKIWNTVYDAQQTAVSAVRPGITTAELDNIHRKVICDAGYGEYIMHSLGHGVGLEIHESPAVSSKTSITLQEKMVITVEPGIYIPGVGGVRTEDMLVVESAGARVLTKSPHLIKI